MNSKKQSLFVGVTIHICRDQGEQENNFSYIEEVIDKRGKGQFKNVLAPCPISVDEANAAIAAIVRIVHRGLPTVTEPLRPLTGDG